VNFATGVNHLGGPQFDDNQCANCHQPQGETDFDASVIGAHVNPNQSSLLPGIQGTILSVTNTSPGQKPVVAFQVKDKTGATIPLSAFSQKNYRLALVLAGPASDYVGINAHGYISEDASKTSVLQGDTYTYTFNTAIPAGATGTYTIGMEGRRYDTVLAGTTKAQTIEYGMKNVVFNFSVDGSAVKPRRAVVSLAKCDGCHWNLQLHGENRNQIEQCVLCHNPIESDAVMRPADGSANPPESIDFALMIHRIHSGPSQTRDFTIYGFGGSKNNFNDVLYPGDLTNCEQCHLPGTYVMPIGATAMINDTRGFISPVHPTTGACLGCHATVDAASHALSNTSTLGESCSVCHGPNGDYSVAKVHASN
jgi:OmcA/MtrC family decaheme c-type cytochrome